MLENNTKMVAAFGELAAGLVKSTDAAESDGETHSRMSGLEHEMKVIKHEMGDIKHEVGDIKQTLNKMMGILMSMDK